MGLVDQLLKDACFSVDWKSLASFSKSDFRKLKRQLGTNRKWGEIMTVTYPAILHPDTNDTYWVEFPDLPGCLTYGDMVDEAKSYATDALSVFLYGESLPFPEASYVDELRAHHSIVRLVTTEIEPQPAREAI